MDKIFQDDAEAMQPSRPARANPEPSADETRHAPAVFILDARLEFCGFNAAFHRTFGSLCGRAPLLHEPVSVLPFHATNLAGDEQAIESLCRSALDGSLLRAQGL